MSRTIWNMKHNYIVEQDGYTGALNVYYCGDIYTFDTIAEAEYFIQELEKTESDIEAIV